MIVEYGTSGSTTLLPQGESIGTSSDVAVAVLPSP